MKHIERADNIIAGMGKKLGRAIRTNPSRDQDQQSQQDSTLVVPNRARRLSDAAANNRMLSSTNPYNAYHVAYPSDTYNRIDNDSDLDTDFQWTAQLTGQKASYYSQATDSNLSKHFNDDNFYQSQRIESDESRPQVPAKDPVPLTKSNHLQSMSNVKLQTLYTHLVINLLDQDYPYMRDVRKYRSESGQYHIIDSLVQLLMDQTLPLRKELNDLNDSLCQRKAALEHAQTQRDLQAQNLDEARTRYKEELRGVRKHYRDHMTILQQNYDHKTLQLEEAERQQAEDGETIRRIQESHKQLEIKYQQLAADKEAEVEQLEASHKLNTDKLIAFQEEQVRISNDELTNAKNEMLAKIRRRELEHVDKLKAIDAEHATEVARLESIHHERITQVEKDYSEQIKDAKTELSNERSRYEREIAQIIAEHQKRETKLNADHQRRGQRLRLDVDELSAALIARDENYLAPSLSIEVKRLDDGDIKARYVEVVQMVDDLARSQWRPNQKVWTDEALQKVGVDQNQRVLRKRILQDIIWTTLHMHIFCSPFRILGREGQILEKQWNAQCGKDPRFDNGAYTWPAPGIETERWRYVTIKECRTALTQLIPSKRDPRARLKRDFMHSIQALRSELKKSLSEIISFKETHATSVEELCRKMANVWLELGMQRYRILLAVHDARLMSSTEKLQRLMDGSIELVVVPTMGRHGNAKEGTDLDEFVVVAGCDGERFRVKH